MSRAEGPFFEMPSGMEIAHYFWERTNHRNLGCEGIDLYRNGRDYCYVWVDAMVDLDMWEAYLLDVRTHVGVKPGTYGETRDFLYVFAGGGGRFDVEWHNQPIRFDAAVDSHRARFRAGMAWLTELVEKSIEDADQS